MASTYSPLKIELIGTGEQAGTWGSTTNTNLGTAIEEAITGSATITFASADVTLTLTDTNSSQTARNLRLVCTGTSGGARQLILGSGCQIEKLYLIQNDLAHTVTVKNTTGTGVAVLPGARTFVFNDGTNVVAATNLTSSTGTLSVTNGGTGQTTYTNGQLLIGNTTGNTLTKATLTAGTGISITNGAGSITVASTVTGDVAGPASATDGAVAIFNGSSGKSLKDGGVSNASINGIVFGKNSGGEINVGNSNTVVSSSGSITIGSNNVASSSGGSLIVGNSNSLNSAANNLALGTNSFIATTSSIGLNGSLNGASDSVAIGAGLISNADTVAIGVGVSAFASPRSVLIGRNAGAVNSGADSVTIGYAAAVSPSHSFAITIGNSISSQGANYFTFGKSGNVVYNQFTVNNSWTQSSDVRLKRNIKDDKLGLSFIMKLRPVTFQWKPSNEVPKELENHHFEQNKKDLEATMNGFIAQEVKQALDDVGAGTQGIWSEQNDGTQALSREMFIMPLVNAVKELKAELDAVKAELAALKG